jgi:hypothetical protein
MPGIRDQYHMSLWFLKGKERKSHRSIFTIKVECRRRGLSRKHTSRLVAGMRRRELENLKAIATAVNKWGRLKG